MYRFSGILVKFADTPLVRASGRELCYVILSGILLCYLNTFILLAKPGIVVCTLQRFTVSARLTRTLQTIMICFRTFGALL